MIDMQLNTSLTISVTSLLFYKQNFKYLLIKNTSVKLGGYSRVFILEYNLNIIKNDVNLIEGLVNSFSKFFTDKLNTYIKSKYKLMLKYDYKPIFLNQSNYLI